MRLKEKVILITGSSTGIGEGMARIFAREGAQLMIHGLEAAEAQKVASDIGGGTAFVDGDLEEPSVPAHLVAETISRFGRIDGLVNNAAIKTRGTIDNTDLALFNRTLAINLTAPYLLIQAALPHFRSQGGGRVLNIGSVNGYCGERNQFAYSISKGALTTLTRNLADAHAAEGIRVNQFNVGWTLTPNEFKLKKSEGFPDDWTTKLSVKDAPSGRLLSPEDIAWAALYFLSDEAALVNGAILDLEQYPMIGRNPSKEV